SPVAWQCIFESPVIAVWEKKDRHTAPVPLRFGIPQSERDILLAIARKTIEDFVLEKKAPIAFETDSIPRRFFQKTDIDVALWADGQLRGSTVMENVGLAEGVAQAAMRSCVDPRFKPVSPYELPSLWVEIAVMSGLTITLSEQEVQKDRIYGEK